MKLITLLAKHFDVEIADFEMEDETLPEAIWIYEKGQDSEPVVILKPTEQPGNWKVGNIYSALPHDAILSEQQLKELVKAGKANALPKTKSIDYIILIYTLLSSGLPLWFQLRHKVKLAFWLYFYFFPDVPDYLSSTPDFNTESIVYISIYYLFL
ncbi:hypothetical protein, partial [Klebsiella pneumoniae]|uniref:hypothetical protein n=1 Tax=Klebsiella pneumoniae TaxID=573 RepID=UPI0021F2B071